MATLETNLFQIAPTAMGRIPLSGFNKGVRGAETTKSASTLGYNPPSQRFTTSVMAVSSPEAVADPSPLRASNRCWARRPSRPQDVPFGKDFTHLCTQSSSTDNTGCERGVEGRFGGSAKGCLSIRACMVDSPWGATPLEHNTLTAAVK
ncbi:hypothetical protein Hanom_Chr05g00442571 [Helianthus anomalus]